MKCQKICQIECQIDCQIECQVECQDICQIECQNICQNICQIGCQNILNICPNIRPDMSHEVEYFILFFVPILHGFWAGKPRNSLQVVRCSYVVPNKGRRCRFPVLPGTSFCGAHREDESVERVPCPLDPNHTVFKSPGAR